MSTLRAGVTRAACIAALLASVSAAAAAQRLVGSGHIAQLPAPVAMATADRFRDAIARVGDDVYIAGQPTELGLRELHAAGVTTVVNLRMPEEMRSVPYDEAAAVAKLGMKYVTLPVRGSAEAPYSPETVTRFATVLAGADGKVLLHCTVGWRASHLWAAYLIRDRGVPMADALANARAINLMDDHRVGPSGHRQPVEDFLDRDIPSPMLAHPPAAAPKPAAP